METKETKLERFNNWCERGLDRFTDYMPAFMVLMMLAIVALFALVIIYGDDRTCIRRGPSTYIQSGSMLTPVPGACLEYAP